MMFVYVHCDEINDLLLLFIIIIILFILVFAVVKEKSLSKIPFKYFLAC